MEKYKIPWIFKWNFDVDTGRVFQGPVGEMVGQIRPPKNHQPSSIELSGHAYIPASILVSSSNGIARNRYSQKIHKHYQTLVQVLPSRENPSHLGPQVRRRSEKSSQLKDLAQQLMAEAALLHNEDSDFEASNADSQHLAITPSQADFQDSQDPFDI